MLNLAEEWIPFKIYTEVTYDSPHSNICNIIGSLVHLLRSWFFCTSWSIYKWGGVLSTSVEISIHGSRFLNPSWPSCMYRVGDVSKVTFIIIMCMPCNSYKMLNVWNMLLWPAENSVGIFLKFFFREGLDILDALGLLGLTFIYNGSPSFVFVFLFFLCVCVLFVDNLVSFCMSYLFAFINAILFVPYF